MSTFLTTLMLLLGWLVGHVSAARGDEATTNRLAGESSPYLRLHAHNPVDWYPWGEDALQRARREGRPIFLSVGYSTCYWCHVMEREVFSDPEIAALMNQWFVNIKVDREERPDLDEIYMTATQLLTGSGGWPNSVFLTPELEPFFAGTYFPPRDSPGRRGFPFVLETLHTAWSERPDEVRRQASVVAAAMKRALEPAKAGGATAANLSAKVIAALESEFDSTWGGFGTTQKFPSPPGLWLLLEHGVGGDDEALSMVLETLRAMGRGAIFDQLAGGFHRYTLDRAWRVPHFEKMLYDNALLAELLSLAYERTGDADFARLARKTLDFVLDRMLLPSGAFASAIDAETDAIEGAFYIWTRDEIGAVLDSKELALLAPILGLDGKPNVESDHHTLFLTASWDEHARRLGISRDALLDQVGPALEKLREARSLREFPFVDDKVLTDWNGMMIAALARGGEILDEDRYREAASRAAGFLLGLKAGDGVLLHTWREGEGRIPALLDDYSFLVHGLLVLEETTGETRWLIEAERLAGELERRLAAPDGGFFASEKQSDVLLQVRSASDGAVPSGNAVAILNLLELAKRTGKDEYRLRAESALQSFAGQVEEYPRAMPTIARGLLRAGSGEARERNDRASSAQGSAHGDDASPRPVVRALARTTERVAPGWEGFELLVDIRQGWHINANPSSEKFLIPTRVSGAVRSMAYPAGETFRPEFTESEIAVYDDTVVISGELQEGAREVSLTYQACDERRCLPPAKVDVEVAKKK